MKVKERLQKLEKIKGLLQELEEDNFFYVIDFENKEDYIIPQDEVNVSDFIKKVDYMIDCVKLDIDYEDLKSK
jgi:hypothetical protein